jgi:hypothetical protein
MVLFILSIGVEVCLSGRSAERMHTDYKTKGGRRTRRTFGGWTSAPHSEAFGFWDQS